MKQPSSRMYDALVRFELRIVINSAISELPEPQRQIVEKLIVELAEDGRFRLEGVADDLAISYDEVCQHVTKAFRSLRHRLAKHPFIQDWLEEHTLAEAALVKGTEAVGNVADYRIAARRAEELSRLSVRNEIVESLPEIKPVWPVVVNIFDDGVTEERGRQVANAALEFLRAFGFVPADQESWEESTGSFYARIKVILKTAIPSEKLGELLRAIADRLVKVEDGVEAKHMANPKADVSEKQADATANLIASLEGIDNAAVAVGPAVIIKRTDGNSKSLVALPLFDELHRRIKAHPECLASAEDLFSMIENLQTQGIKEHIEIAEFENFVMTYPCWILVGENTRTGHLNADTLVLTAWCDGEEYIPVFTDKDLASRFVNDKGIGGAAIAAFDTKTKFLDYLKRLTIPFLGFDPQKAGTAFRFNYFIDPARAIEVLSRQ